MKFIQPAMSPLDVVVLAKLCLLKEPNTQIALAKDLALSQSEISKSMARSTYAGLLYGTDQQVMRQGFFDFLKYGIRYAFPHSLGLWWRRSTAHVLSPIRSDFMKSLCGHQHLERSECGIAPTLRQWMRLRDLSCMKS